MPPEVADLDAARALSVSVRSIELLRVGPVEEGPDAALERRKQVRPSVHRMFDGEKEAKLIAIACGPKREGRTQLVTELVSRHVVVTCYRMLSDL